MTIALELLEAYVKCPTKCWLISKREPISDSGHTQWAEARNEAYLASGVQRLLSETPHAECIISPSADTLKTGKWGLATNVVARAQCLESHLHAVKRMPSEGRGKPGQYSPVRFVPNNRLGKDARLLLAFDALALAEVLGEKVSFGQIIHGDDQTTLRVRIPDQAGEVQKHLIVITPKSEPEITVDDIELAQFIFLLLSNRKIRQVIDTVTSRVVLILGRFTAERKALLDRIRGQLRTLGRVPILFDFEKPLTQTTDETIATLAHMSRFVIADLTDAKSVLQELRSIVPNSPSVIVQPLLLASQEEPGMWDFFRRFPWVLEPVRYTDQEELIAALDEKVIAPAEARALPSQSQWST